MRGSGRRGALEYSIAQVNRTNYLFLLIRDGYDEGMGIFKVLEFFSFFPFLLSFSFLHVITRNIRIHFERERERERIVSQQGFSTLLYVEKSLITTASKFKPCHDVSNVCIAEFRDEVEAVDTTVPIYLFVTVKPVSVAKEAR